MLTRQDNELLTSVGPGTPTGNLLRQYWIPAFLPWEVESDGAPLRVRLLGENLVAFRTTDGQIGLVADNCPHRGASMWFGRNEENGLRCVYHGWKFDASGACVDMPNEPPESNFKHKVTITAYPCREVNGVVWVYMGPRSEPPALPNMPWVTLTPSQRYVSMRVQDCNWAQAVEGGIDSSHVSFLHSALDDSGQRMTRADARTGASLPSFTVQDSAPHFEVLDTPYGVLIGARRGAGAEDFYWRITQFLMPFYTMIPGTLDPQGNCSGHAWVPMDDRRTMTWSITWNHSRDLTEDEIERFKSFPGGGIHYGRAGMKPRTTEAGGNWMPALCAANDFGLSHELQRTQLFIGIEQFGTQDSAIQETMGKIYDRTKERLGSADTAIIRYRRRIINASKALRDTGAVPPGVDSAASYFVRSASLVMPRTQSWVDASAEARVPRLLAR